MKGEYEFKRFGIIVQDKDGNRVEGMKVELTDFSTSGHELGVFFDSGITDKFGLAYLNPEENMIERHTRMQRIEDMFKK